MNHLRTRQEIFKRKQMIEAVLGYELININKLPKNISLKLLNIAWEKEIHLIQGVRDAIDTWAV